MDAKIKKILLSFIAFDICAILSQVRAQEPDSILTTCWPSSQFIEKKGEKYFTYHNNAFDIPSPTSTDISQMATEIPKDLQGPIRRVRLISGKKLLALTFDLCELSGEIAGYDREIVQYLREKHIKATFFAGGKWMRSHAERAHQLMVDPLFEIANHSESHLNLRLLKNKELNNQIIGPENTFYNLRTALLQNRCVRQSDPNLEHVPKRMFLFRFPFGACDQVSISAVNNAGYLIIQWDISMGDPVKTQSAQAIAKTIIKAKPGSIIIGHANGHGFNTAEALRIALPELIKKGFEFVTVSELLREGSPEISKTCYDSRPGDTDKYDTFFLKRKK